MGMQLGDGKVDDFKLGDKQVDKIFLGRALVWPNTAITDFKASDSRVREIKITFTDPNVNLPLSYDLYQNGILASEDVESGDIFDAVEGTDPYYVRALYEGGHGINSNTNSGTALEGIAPGPITDFEASDNQVFQVQCWWTNATGDPKPTYDLYEDGDIVAQGVTSGHIQAAALGTRPWHVMAVNIMDSVKSNVDDGTAVDVPPDPITVDFTSSGDLYVPPGYSTATICMIGGGGGGGGAEASYSAGGGWAGIIVNETIAVTEGTYPIIIGKGGIGGLINGDMGSPGTNSSALGFTSQGGGGGSPIEKLYNGNGAFTNNCMGQFQDGATEFTEFLLSGGQAGFGNGGNGFLSAPLGANDGQGYGSGGGSNGSGAAPGDNQGGTGGDGFARITLT